MQPLPTPIQQLHFEDSILSIWEAPHIVQFISDKIANNVQSPTSKSPHKEDEQQLLKRMRVLNQQDQITGQEWLNYFNFFYEHHYWQPNYNNEGYITFVQLTKRLFDFLIHNSNEKITNEIQQVFEMHLRHLSFAIEIDQPIIGNWRIVLVEAINYFSQTFPTTPFYKALLKQNEYTKVSYTLPPDETRDGYVSRESKFMTQLSVGQIYNKLFDFWGLLNINSKKYIDIIIKHIEEVVIPDYAIWIKWGNAKSQVKSILYYYYYDNQYAVQQLEQFLERLQISEDANAQLLLKHINNVLHKINSLKTLHLNRFEDLIQCYQEIGFSTFSTQDIHQLIYRHSIIFELESTNFYNLSTQKSLVLNELLSQALGLREYSRIRLNEKDKYQTIKNALQKALKKRASATKKQQFWLDFFITRAQHNIEDYEAAENADLSKILAIAQELKQKNILPQLPTEQEVKTIIFDSNPKQKKKIVKEILAQKQIIVRFDAEAGLLPLPYDSLNELLYSSVQSDLPNLQFLTEAKLIDEEQSIYTYKIFYICQNKAFQFEETSSSDYYCNTFVSAFNQILAICGIQKQFLEQQTSDQTYCFYYMTPKQLNDLNKTYKLFKKKK